MRKRGDTHGAGFMTVASVAPPTPEELERSRRARWKGGRYSASRTERRQQFGSLVRVAHAELDAIRRELKTVCPGRDANLPPL